MTARSQRALLVMTMVLAALCADQVVVAEGIVRPQAMMEALEEVAGRLVREEQRRQPTPVRCTHVSRQWTSARVPTVADAVWHVHPSELNQKDLRLPPPVR